MSICADCEEVKILNERVAKLEEQIGKAMSERNDMHSRLKDTLNAVAIVEREKQKEKKK